MIEARNKDFFVAKDCLISDDDYNEKREKLENEGFSNMEYAEHMVLFGKKEEALNALKKAYKAFARIEYYNSDFNSKNAESIYKSILDLEGQF